MMVRPKMSTSTMRKIAKRGERFDTVPDLTTPRQRRSVSALSSLGPLLARRSRFFLRHAQSTTLSLSLLRWRGPRRARRQIRSRASDARAR